MLGLKFYIELTWDNPLDMYKLKKKAYTNTNLKILENKPHGKNGEIRITS